MLLRESFAVACAVFDASGRLVAHSQTSSPGLVGLLQEILSERLRSDLSLAPEEAWVEVVPGTPAGIAAVQPIYGSSGLEGFIASAGHLPGEMPELRLRISRKDETGLDGLSQALQREASVLLAGNELGVRRLGRLLQEWNASLTQLSNHILRASQRAVKKNIGQQLLGEKRHCARRIEVGGMAAEGRPARQVELAIQVHQHEADRVECLLSAVEIDFLGNAASDCILDGSSAACSRAFAQFAFLTMFGRDVPGNHGSFSVFDIKVAAGSLLDKASSATSNLACFLPDLIYACLAGALTESDCVAPPPAESSSCLHYLQWPSPATGLLLRRLQAGVSSQP